MHENWTFENQAAGVLLESASGNILLVQHNYGLRRFSFPGGIVETDESPEDAAVREALEEIGVQVQLNGRFGTYLVKGLNRPTICVHIFRAAIEHGQPEVADPKEIANLTWVDIHSPPSPLTTDAGAVIQDLKSGTIGSQRIVWREL